MGKVYKIARGDMIFVVMLLFLLGFIAGTNLAPTKTVFKEYYNQSANIAGEKVVTMGLPAVDADGNGVVGKLTTTIRPGSGQVLVNINNVLAQFDTQFSGRTAAQVASNYTLIDLGGIDVIYDIQVNASVIEGPSAGAAMAASIVLALDNISAPKNIMMTGTINGNGSVGNVGSVLEKAAAAKADGATVFLVPQGQSTEARSNRTRECRNTDGIYFCIIRYDYTDINIGSSLNITVKEVSTISDIIKIYKNYAAAAIQ